MKRFDTDLLHNDLVAHFDRVDERAFDDACFTYTVSGTLTSWMKVFRLYKDCYVWMAWGGLFGDRIETEIGNELQLSIYIHWLWDVMDMRESGHLTLGEFLSIINGMDPERVVPVGLWSPHSYRGYYSCLGLSVKATPMAMKDMQKRFSYIDTYSFDGYKGGRYQMHMDTLVYVAEWGEEGIPLTKEVLGSILEGRWIING